MTTLRSDDENELHAHCYDIAFNHSPDEHAPDHQVETGTTDWELALELKRRVALRHGDVAIQVIAHGTWHYDLTEPLPCDRLARQRLGHLQNVYRDALVAIRDSVDLARHDNGATWCYWCGRWSDSGPAGDGLLHHESDCPHEIARVALGRFP